MPQINQKHQKTNKTTKPTEVILPVQTIQASATRLPENCLVVPMIVLAHPEPVKHLKTRRK